MSVFRSHKLFLLSFTSECPLLSSSRSAEDLYEACASAAWLGDMAFWRWSRAWSRGRTHLATPPHRHKSLTKTDPTAFAALQELCCWSAGGLGWGVGGGRVADEQLDSVSVSGWEWTNGAWFLHFLLTLTRWLTANQNKWQRLSRACDRVWCNVVDSINNCFKVAGVVCSELMPCRSWL